MLPRCCFGVGFEVIRESVGDCRGSDVTGMVVRMDGVDGMAVREWKWMV